MKLTYRTGSVKVPAWDDTHEQMLSAVIGLLCDYDDSALRERVLKAALRTVLDATEPCRASLEESPVTPERNA